MTTLPVITEGYEREHGRKPAGNGFWRFRLCTSRVTEKDHFVSSETAQAYDKALARAIDVASRRRSDCIVVLP